MKRLLAGLAVSALCVVGITGCTTDDQNAQNDDILTSESGLTGGIAAKVNDEEIEEDQVTRYINNLRLSQNLAEEEDWKEYLENQKETPLSIRDQVLDTLIDQQLILQCADQRGVTTDDEEIQSYVEKMRANYSTDEAWQTGLEGAGFEDEDAYREALHYSILQKKLSDGFEAESTLDDAALLAAAQESISTYDGAKRSSHILFGTEDKDKAEEVLEQIRNGEISFADAVEQYSTDEGSKVNGGDVGWDKLNSFVSEYTTALLELENGAMSDLVESQYGYHIILVTDVFNAPETLTSLDEIPEDILTEIRTTTEETNTDDAMDAWLEQLRETNEVIIYPMPEGLPYWVDMSDVFSEEEIANIDANAEAKLTTDVEVEEQDVTAEEAIDDATDAALDAVAAGEDGQGENTETSVDNAEGASTEESGESN